jgi:hypothetical protein
MRRCWILPLFGGCASSLRLGGGRFRRPLLGDIARNLRKKIAASQQMIDDDNSSGVHARRALHPQFHFECEGRIRLSSTACELRSPRGLRQSSARR